MERLIYEYILTNGSITVLEAMNDIDIIYSRQWAMVCLTKMMREGFLVRERQGRNFIYRLKTEKE